MLAILLIAASLATQAWLFSDKPSRPADRCAAEPGRCPEWDLDSMLARQERDLDRMRKVARGEDPDAPAVAAPVAVPMDSNRAQACRLFED